MTLWYPCCCRQLPPPPPPPPPPPTCLDCAVNGETPLRLELNASGFVGSDIVEQLNGSDILVSNPNYSRCEWFGTKLMSPPASGCSALRWAVELSVEWLLPGWHDEIPEGPVGYYYQYTGGSVMYVCVLKVRLDGVCDQPNVSWPTLPGCDGYFWHISSAPLDMMHLDIFIGHTPAPNSPPCDGAAGAIIHLRAIE